MMKAVDIASSETERETVKDTLLIKERKRKAKEKDQHQAGLKPTTSISRGMCSTALLQPLPKLIKLTRFGCPASIVFDKHGLQIL